MPVVAPHMRRALIAVSTGLVLFISSHAGHATVIINEPTSPPLQIEAPDSKAPFYEGLESTFGTAVTDALRRGRWTSACNTATSILARQEPDIDALGVFALCAAVRNDRKAASSALDRLRQVEAAPYYGLLTQGILYLKDQTPDRAEGVFKAVLQEHPGDPIALYFSGETLNLQHKDAEAISAFTSVLKRWPDYTPGMIAAARLMAAPKASKEDLNAAIAMTKRAITIDPSNRGYWGLLAKLYDRTGQHDRANAIAIQWLRPPPAIK